MTENKLKSSPESKNESTTELKQEQQPKKVGATTEQKTPVSKLAILSLLIALLAITGCAAIYYWFEQQQSLLVSSLNQQAQSQRQTNEATTKQLLAEQQALFDQQVTNLNQAMTADNQQVIEQLQTTVKRLSATQPTDWLLHEAEYLIRVAGRTLWLEQDTRAAINLLNDASERLKQLKQPKYLPAREAIYQDIEALALLPKLDTEEVVLTLMGLSHQVTKLSLALAYVPDSTETEADFELSNNSDDWQENLSKTWQRFLTDFITVRRRSDNVEPLLTPQQQQNLHINLRLKLQQAQLAASRRMVPVYQQSLVDIQQWLTSYFDMDNEINTRFYQTIEKLKQQNIVVNLPSELNALSAIRQVMKNQLSDVELMTDRVQAPVEKEVLIHESDRNQTDKIELVAPTEREITKPASSPVDDEQLINEVDKKNDSIEEIKQADEKSDEDVI